MMKLQRIKVFDDTDEIIDVLHDMAKRFGQSSQDHYWTKEAIENLSGLWQLCNEQQKEIMKMRADIKYLLDARSNGYTPL